MNYITLPPSSWAEHSPTTDALRLWALWRENYRLARRDEDPLSALLTAALSTAETWRLVR